MKTKGKKKGGFGFNMPDISMPKFGGSGKVKGSVDAPDVDVPSAEIGDAKVGGDIDANIEAPDAPKVDVDLKAGGGIDVDSPDAKGSVELPSGKISVKDPSIYIDTPSPKVMRKGGFGIEIPDFHLPKFG